MGPAPFALNNRFVLAKQMGPAPFALNNRFVLAKQMGFTLIEVTLVSVIILILITLSMPIFRMTYEDLRISSSAKDIAQMITFARERAVFERINYRFVVDDTANTYQVLAQYEERGEFEPLKDRWGRVSVVPDGIDIQADIKSIDFSPSGISSHAVIYLTSGKGKTYSITLDGKKGIAKVDDKTE
jgi:prepilin-type N-terminal cleavage/methylation domain-containing protein